MDSRLDKMDSRLEILEKNTEKLLEDSDEFRSNINTLIEWADDVGRIEQIPLIKHS
jgi:chaperonin cofactor prefoldin